MCTKLRRKAPRLDEMEKKDIGETMSELKTDRKELKNDKQRKAKTK